jgi:hypothetical protein
MLQIYERKKGRESELFHAKPQRFNTQGPKGFEVSKLFASLRNLASLREINPIFQTRQLNYLRATFQQAKTLTVSMKKIGFFLLFLTGFIACNNQTDAPDVSNIKISIAVNRFDRDFFSMDTNAVDRSLPALQQQYPNFLNLFLQNIVGVNDAAGVKDFYRLYKPVYDSSQRIYEDLDPVKKELEQAFRHVNFYFPAYKAPARIVTIIGPMNSREDLARMTNGDYTPNFIGPDFIGISLQFYLGDGFSLYNTEYFVNNVAPLYRSRRFSREYITADVMKLVTDDLFPDKSNTRPLIEQMIEKGKQWWLLDKLMPDSPDSIKTGYSQLQLDWCRQNEGLIWSYILKNEDLYSINPATIQTYIGEAPFTSVFSQEESPGNIGAWIGRQIVKKYVETNSGMKPEEVMMAAPKEILEKSKYKPK